MTKKPASVADLIDQWGKITRFAADVGCGYEAARQMRRRQSIAPEHWASVVAASKSKGLDGITFEWLAEQRASSSEHAA